jgi:hypothetical protein
MASKIWMTSSKQARPKVLPLSQRENNSLLCCFGMTLLLPVGIPYSHPSLSCPFNPNRAPSQVRAQGEEADSAEHPRQASGRAKLQCAGPNHAIPREGAQEEARLERHHAQGPSACTDRMLALKSIMLMTWIGHLNIFILMLIFIYHSGERKMMQRKRRLRSQ